MAKNGAKIGKVVAVGALAISLVSGAGARTTEQGMEAKKANEMSETKQRLYCNTKALTGAERARHEALTKKLLEKRTAVVETGKGYELQFSPADVTVAEVAEWVVAESKCCAFFNFHIDLENAGTLICLRLTGAEEVKAFIRSEFALK